MILILIVILSSNPCYSADSEFFIKSKKQTRVFKYSDLKAHKDMVPITIKNDPAYAQKSMTYSAVPLHALFESIPLDSDATLVFHCLDGFSAPISRERVLSTSKDRALAYLAIEDPQSKWPPLSPESSSHSTAGPYYLVWLNPELSKVGREEWPFQLSGFEIKPALKTLYPAIFPDARLASNHPVSKGFQVFQKNCFSCHSINQQGNSDIGPDLNWPTSPTEYFRGSFLRKLIRDPQELRRWKKSKMPGFSEQDLSDKDLDDLLAYLTHMSKKKRVHESGD